MRWLLGAALGGCARHLPGACVPEAPAGPVVWVTDHGWHTEIGLRPDDLTGPLAGHAATYPGAAALTFGFGKRSFLLAEAGALEEYLLGAIPGAGAMQVTGLTVPVPVAFPHRTTTVLLPEGGAARLSAFLWDSIGKDPAGRPLPALPGPLHGSLFYEATRGYSLGYTCNTWTATALRHAGLPINDRGVVLAGAVLGQLGTMREACGPVAR